MTLLCSAPFCDISLQKAILVLPVLQLLYTNATEQKSQKNKTKNSLLTAAGKLIGQTVVHFVVLDARYLVLQQMEAGLALAHVRVVRVDTQLRAQTIETLAEVHYLNACVDSRA